ncbi:hypothetical protein GC1_00010 [Gluconobacter phage GC1]|uniref:Uncharacterized protein n=1 Tax=Gluconobacter phage GC1 TaxID=2047788 RepID=A0A2I5AR69_9VIRU|nr:hypothetical protein FDJ08_gp10 [Gluconobacter phage GC1]ATS92578.1 hypothetical protein GC1_00010 [Gluconobacter phage GC1]
MERVYITWTISNWITIVLMVFLAAMVFNLAGYGYQKISGG